MPLDSDTLRSLERHGLPLVREGDRVEFLGFGAPDQYFDPQTQTYQPVPNQLQPGTQGTVRDLGAGQLLVDWDSGHKIGLVVGPYLVADEGFQPDRYRLIEPTVVASAGVLGPRTRPSSLAERTALALTA